MDFDIYLFIMFWVTILGYIFTNLRVSLCHEKEQLFFLSVWTQNSVTW
jgi:hypothetical protein